MGKHIPYKRSKTKMKQDKNFEPLDAAEMNWLAQHRFDLYYSLNVEEMFEKDQKIFRSISEKLEKSDKS